MLKQSRPGEQVAAVRAGFDGAGGGGGIAAVDREEGGDAQDHADPAAKPEEQFDPCGRAGSREDRDREVKAEKLRF